jgi:hypothetical protein
MHDKKFWQAIAANKFEIPAGETAAGLTGELLDFRGNPDPDLRDDVTYGFIARRVMAGDYTPDDYRGMLQKLVPDLQTRLGESGTDSVMLRSYSALLISLVVYGDTKTPFLTPDEVEALANAAMGYLLAEKDLRGYEAGKGWLHATAHTADVLKFLARNQHITRDMLGMMLKAIADKLLTPVDYVYIHGEDERLALAAVGILKREMLDNTMLEEFVNYLLTVLEMAEPDGAFNIVFHATYTNVKNFLRAFYFRLAFMEDMIVSPDDLEFVFDALRKFPT